MHDVFHNVLTECCSFMGYQSLGDAFSSNATAFMFINDVTVTSS